jgi:hypothetical protein
MDGMDAMPDSPAVAGLASTCPGFSPRRGCDLISIILNLCESERRGSADETKIIFGEIQVLLAEKRTALASLRTGIAVFALPLSVLSALIATSRYYSMRK